MWSSTNLQNECAAVGSRCRLCLLTETTDTFHFLTSLGVSLSSYLKCTPRYLLNRSTGWETFQPLNCQAAPWATTATTFFQSLSESRRGSSTNLKDCTTPSPRVRDTLITGSFLAPCCLFWAGVTKVFRSSKSAALTNVRRAVGALGTIIIPTVPDVRGFFFASCFASSRARFLSAATGSFFRSFSSLTAFSLAFLSSCCRFLLACFSRSTYRSQSRAANEKSLPGMQTRAAFRSPRE
mmetsp:Transcript_18508/g.48296  ORF Transcript_18508/g.48296 Transcript_18508/m.48296 type:complete len:238 (-) Transcript_18508:593-1306(-)